MSQEVAGGGGGGGEWAKKEQERSYLMMKMSTATILSFSLVCTFPAPHKVANPKGEAG